MKRKCQEVRDVLSGFVDGEIAPAVIDEIAKHLEDCPGCSDEEKAQRAVKILLRNRAPLQAAPEHLRARILHHLRTQRQRLSFRSLIRQLIDYQPLPTFATAALLIVTTATVSLWGSMAVVEKITGSNPLTVETNSQMEAEIVCVDCTLLEALKTPSRHDRSHRLGLRCEDGYFWNIVQTAKGSELSALENLWHRRVRIRGHIFHEQHMVEVTDFSII